MRFEEKFFTCISGAFDIHLSIFTDSITSGQVYLL